MTKIYLVYTQGCHSNGTLDLNSKKYVTRVFTNKKLANNYANYMNQEWQLGHSRNTDFKKDNINFYYVYTTTISHEDFSKLPF